jgi:diguanylate cyclase (GGDEF)-like protein/PAS domain S-box-containing protein
VSDIVAATRKARDATLRVVFDSAGDAILVCDAETGGITEVNATACAMFGFARDELVGATIEDLSTGVAPYAQADAMTWLERARSVGPQLFEWHCKTKSGLVFWGEVSLCHVSLGGRPAGVAIVRDISERKRRQDAIVQQARHDTLTGLPNRRDFDDRLQHEIARCERYGGKLSVAIGDIDNFKTVNDTFGHQIGDEVLKQLARFMRKNLRRTDYVARWGGEEFTVLMLETDLDEAAELLDRLRAGIATHPIAAIGGPVTLSFGVAEYAKSDSADALLKRVDDALYQSKQSGRNRLTKIPAG